MVVTPLLIAAALAAPPPPASPAPPPTKSPDIVVVGARPVDPKVTATYPADGAKIPGGELILKIAFDQPMIPEAWSYSPAPGGAFPDCLNRPRLLNDKKTFVLLCSAALNGAYAVQINAAPDFVTVAHRTAAPFVLRFSTTGEMAGNLHDALAGAGLTDADDPIMSWDGASANSAAGVASAPPQRP